MTKLLLIRHAERPEIPKNAVGNEVLLTEKGKSDTKKFAKTILDTVISVHSSPIDRCRQTAEIIAHEVGFPPASIVFDRDLGDPGFIINDGSKAWVHWQHKGHQRVNEHLLAGSDLWEGFEDLDQAVAIFDNKIRNQLSMLGDGVHVWVTHDTILATFASRVLPDNLTENQWPQYLGYISVEFKNGVYVYDYFDTGMIDGKYA